MTTNTIIEAEVLQVWQRLVVALGQLGCCRIQQVGDEMRIYEPEYHCLCYDVRRGFIVIAIEGGQLAPGWAEQLLNSRKGQVVLKAILGRDAMTIVEGGLVYFRAPLPRVAEPMAA